MRKKSLSEEPPIHPQTRKVILINNSTPPHPILASQQPFTTQAQPQNNENSNIGNMPHAPSSASFPKQIPHSLIIAPQRPLEFPLIQSQMEMILGSLFQLSEEVSTLMTRLDTLETKFLRIEERTENQSGHSRKKVRRKADEINKTFFCLDESCRKAYGSEVSLNLHMRLKHSSGTKQPATSKQRDRTISRKSRRKSINESNSNHNDQEEEQL